MPFSWVRGFNIVMSYLLKLIYRFETIPTKISPLFVEIVHLGFIWKWKGPVIAKEILKEQTK